jgi:TonB family protein
MNLAAFDRALGVIWIEVMRHLWQSALVLSPLFLVAHVLRSAPARWSHRLWAAALAKLFIPAALFAPLAGAARERFLAKGAGATQGNAPAGYQAIMTVFGASSAAPATSALDRFPTPFFTCCTLVYLAIAFWLIVRMSRDIIASRRIARVAVTIDGDRSARLDGAILASGIARDRVIVSSANLIPAVIGTIRPRIVVPVKLLDALELDELTAVLLHEEMHRRNADPAIAVVQRLASSLLFFFPLLAPLHRRLREAAELRCDEDALRAGAEPQTYVRALARTIRLGLEPSPAPSALGDGNPSLVARRLARLAEPLRTKTMARHFVAIAAAAGILAVGVFLPVAPAKVIDGTEPVIPELDRLWNREHRISLQFENASAARVLDALASAGKIRVVMDGPEDCCLVTVSLVDVPLRRALEVVATQVDLHYRVTNFDTLHVRLPEPLVPTGDDITMPEVLNRPEPNYPNDARNARAEGKVVLRAVIREDGTVGDVQVVKHAEGWPSMDEAALIAVRQRTYRPAMKNGHAVSIYFTIRVDFRLR